MDLLWKFLIVSISAKESADCEYTCKARGICEVTGPGPFGQEQVKICSTSPFLVFFNYHSPTCDEIASACTHLHLNVREAVWGNIARALPPSAETATRWSAPTATGTEVLRTGFYLNGGIENKLLFKRRYWDQTFIQTEVLRPNFFLTEVFRSNFYLNGGIETKLFLDKPHLSQIIKEEHIIPWNCKMWK